MNRIKFRRLAAIAAALAVLAGCRGVTHAAELKAGQVAPDFQLKNADEKTVKLTSFAGKKNVVLVFARGHW